MPTKLRRREFPYNLYYLGLFSYATPTLCQDGLREPISLLTKLQSAEAPFRLELKHFFESFHVLGNHQFALNGDSLLGRLGADIFNSKCDRLKFMFMGYLVRFMEITVITTLLNVQNHLISQLRQLSLNRYNMLLHDIK